MKKWIALALLLFALPVHAATATYTFEGTHNQLDFPPYNPVNPQTNGGITATFGTGFSFSRSLPLDPLRTCLDPSYNFPSYTVQTQGMNTGYFRNAPSGEWAVRYSHDYVAPFDVPARTITFSTPIRYFGAWIAGVTGANGWACNPYVAYFIECPGQPNTHFQCYAYGGGLSPQPGGSGTVPHFEFWNNSNQITGTGYPQQVNAWAGCDEEYPDGPPYSWTYENGAMCNWQWVEMYSPTPVSKVYFRIDGNFWYPLFLDNITVSTLQCPNPPCSFERAQIAPENLQNGLLLDNPTVPDLTAEYVNKETGQVMRVNNKQHPTAITPATRRTWGAVKQIYR